MRTSSTEVARGQAPISIPGLGGGVTRSAWYILLLLQAVNMLNFIDRNLPFILIEGIRRDIGLTDTQIGLIGGLAFTLVYSIAGLPIGWISDRSPRKVVLGVAVASWGLMTAAGGMATSFAQLAASRVGLALGEASVHPTATSIIADIFPPEKRRSALAIYLIGGMIGVMLGLVFGGWLSERLSWRIVLFLFAVPALLLSALVFLTVREPVRGGRGEAVAGGRRDVLSLFRIPAFRQVGLALCMVVFAAMSVTSFTPAFVLRRYGLSASEVGLAIGLSLGGGSAAGTLVGGLLADRLRRLDVRWGLWLPAIGLVAGVPFFFVAWFSPAPIVCLVVLPAAFFLSGMYLAPAFAVGQELAGPHRRGVAISILGVCQYAIGGSLGPVLTGFLSDRFKPSLGTMSLAYAMAIISVGYLLAALHFWLASRTLVRDLAATRTTSTT